MYRVVNWEDEDEAEMVAGLTLEQAATKRLQLAGYLWKVEQVEGIWTLFVSAHPRSIHRAAGPLQPVCRSAYTDVRSAEQQLWQWVADAPLSGPYIVVTEREYQIAENHLGNDAEEGDELIIPVRGAG